MVVQCHFGGVGTSPRGLIPLALLRLTGIAENGFVPGPAGEGDLCPQCPNGLNYLTLAFVGAFIHPFEERAVVNIHTYKDL